MQEGRAVPVRDPNLISDADVTNQRPALSADGELKTMRKPSVDPADLPTTALAPLPSFPLPESSASFTSEAGPPSVELNLPPERSVPPPPPLGSAPPPAKQSWLRALVSATFPPGAEKGGGAISANAAGTAFAV